LTSTLAAAIPRILLRIHDAFLMTDDAPAVHPPDPTDRAILDLIAAAAPEAVGLDELAEHFGIPAPTMALRMRSLLSLGCLAAAGSATRPVFRLGPNAIHDPRQRSPRPKANGEDSAG
jgi:hypothetical protein